MKNHHTRRRTGKTRQPVFMFCESDIISKNGNSPKAPAIRRVANACHQVAKARLDDGQGAQRTPKPLCESTSVKIAARGFAHLHGFVSAFPVIKLPTLFALHLSPSPRFTPNFIRTLAKSFSHMGTDVTFSMGLLAFSRTPPFRRSVPTAYRWYGETPQSDWSFSATLPTYAACFAIARHKTFKPE